MPEARPVRVRRARLGAPTVIDGPFAETKESIAGRLHPLRKRVFGADAKRAPPRSIP